MKHTPKQSQWEVVNQIIIGRKMYGILGETELTITKKYEQNFMLTTSFIRTHKIKIKQE